MKKVDQKILALIAEIKCVLEKTPNVLGKEIAKKLNLDKTTINRFLSDHSSYFLKNSDYTWRNRPSDDCVTVEFNNGWIDCDSFENSLRTVDFLSVKINSVVFIFCDNSKFLLEVTARFLSLCNQIIDLGKSVTIDFGENNNLRLYLNRAGFYDLLNKSAKVLPRKPVNSLAKIYKGNSSGLVEIGSIALNSVNTELARELAKAFVSKSNQEYQVPIFTIFGELIGNVVDHSSSTLGGFAALQHYETIPAHIQTVVSDSGVGIVNTLTPALSEHYPDLLELSNIALVEAVMKKGLISKHGAKRGNGQGFRSSKESALRFSAKYSLRQKTFSLELHFKDGALKDTIRRTDLVPIHGTHICFDFTVDSPSSPA